MRTFSKVASALLADRTNHSLLSSSVSRSVAISRFRISISETEKWLFSVGERSCGAGVPNTQHPHVVSVRCQMEHRYPSTKDLANGRSLAVLQCPLAQPILQIASHKLLVF